MKNQIFKFLAVAGILGCMGECTSDRDWADHPVHKPAPKPANTSKTKTYQIRYGMMTQSGVKTLSGSYDVGSFTATNIQTAESYDTYAGGGLQALPVYMDGIPAGTYTFTAQQGQGGWVGYGSVTGTVSDEQVDSEGYITIYIPIAWAE
ncbi:MULTISPECIES: hypothetical protein [Chryseobacterium]|uniref:Lipoprotein n=1 Tax=Chryseobacterium camelliae TaxID=1265445 RepID=A0ABU0TKA3_9FLAO|nr:MULTISPECIES: hypothetical protein [Chryseobacterium]MDT3408672.1 hypothetical protein [Pseudacidovorax intermedius]MDQ1097474.1 hypothetical protein [Chryseobacterium camelliae]MDQ1101403.1 hypothetical protein [Chryseobacterium sp. SORGH_AS_1048]MDR6084847.1 hypothetical protein [Chryseobacterium sp. SORGH_AS_0909]MDR6129197.1 hypothetical protein [Chryseobacterium sp. SORGH_AS_1175]